LYHPVSHVVVTVLVIFSVKLKKTLKKLSSRGKTNLSLHEPNKS
jgi:hypothetical protein